MHAIARYMTPNYLKAYGTEHNWGPRTIPLTETTVQKELAFGLRQQRPDFTAR